MPWYRDCDCATVPLQKKWFENDIEIDMLAGGWRCFTGNLRLNRIEMVCSLCSSVFSAQCSLTKVLSSQFSIVFLYFTPPLLTNPSCPCEVGRESETRFSVSYKRKMVYNVAHESHESHQKAENYRIIWEQHSSNKSIRAISIFYCKIGKSKCIYCCFLLFPRFHEVQIFFAGPTAFFVI